MSLSQYLARYAEPDIALSRIITDSYDRLLCLPAYAESNSLLNTLSTLPSKESVLVILSINSPDSNSSVLAMTKAAQTIELLEFLQRSLTPKASIENATYATLTTSPKRDILLIDHCTIGRGLPEKEGVGLARKICTDIACQLISEGKITSSWIHCSDADVSFPQGYFSAADHLCPKSTAVALFPFRHTTHQEPKIRASQALYDLSLYYYVEGLKFADSPYAYHTIGSTLIINAFHYALVRGFPKRSAAEDFYILNKLAKTGRVHSLDTPTLSIETRVSDRVPFGTGPALNTILEMKQPKKDFLFYHPQLFDCLKAFLKSFSLLWELKAHEIDVRLESCFSSTLMPYQIQVIECLEELSFQKALDHAFTQSNSSSKFIKHLHQWFDAFKTLRFIHLMRDKTLPSLTKEDCMNSAVFQAAEQKLASSLHQR